MASSECAPTIAGRAAIEQQAVKSAIRRKPHPIIGARATSGRLSTALRDDQQSARDHRERRLVDVADVIPVDLQWQRPIVE